MNVLLLTVATAVSAWVGLRFFDPEAVGLSYCWAVAGLLFVAVALAWDEGGRRLRVIALSAAGMAPAAYIGGALAGASPGTVTRLLGADVVAVVGAVWIYQRGGPRSWVPRAAPEAVRLMVAIIPAALVGAALGGYPTEGGDALGDPQTILWAAARLFTVLAISANCGLPVVFAATERASGRAGVRTVLLLVMTGAVGAVVPSIYPELPLSPLLLVPAVCAGLWFGPLKSGLAMLVLNVALVFVPYPHTEHAHEAGLLNPDILIDLTQGFITHVAITLSAFRENLARLRLVVQARADTERAQHHLLEGLVSALSDGLLLSDRDGRVALANPAARALVGDVPERLTLDWVRAVELQDAQTAGLLDAPVWDAILRPPDGGRPRRDLILPARAAAPASAGERRLVVSSHEVDVGSAQLTLILAKDVTVAHARQQQLESFAGTVAHDLKGPLTALTGWMEAAEEEFAAGDAAAGTAMLGRAQEAIFRMRALIDDYLAYAVTRGGVLTLTDVSLAQVALEIVELYAARHDTRSPTFEIDAPHVLHVDAALTRQLMANIIGNGIKYASPERPPYLRIRSVDDDPGWAEVQVADRGRGLQAGDEERIFAGFARSAKDSADVSGIGLGLALCHAIVTRHGGRIMAENNEWGGATFRFTLPAAAPAGG